MNKLNTFTTTFLASLALVSVAEAAPFGIQTQAGTHFGTHVGVAGQNISGSATGGVNASASGSAPQGESTVRDVGGKVDTAAGVATHEAAETSTEAEAKARTAAKAVRQHGTAEVKATANVAAQGQAKVQGDGHQASAQTQTSVGAAVTGTVNAEGRAAGMGETGAQHAKGTANRHMADTGAAAATRSHTAVKTARQSGNVSVKANVGVQSEADGQGGDHRASAGGGASVGVSAEVNGNQ